MRLGISLVMESDIGASFAGLVYRELRDGTDRHALTFRHIGESITKIPLLDGFLKLLAERYPLPAQANESRA